MKIGIFTVLFQRLSFEETLDKVVAAGLQAVEVGAGNYAPLCHCNPDILLGDDTQFKEFKQAIEKRELIPQCTSDGWLQSCIEY